MSDVISLHDLTLIADIGPDWAGRLQPQPILITVHVYTSLERAGASDNLTHSISYSRIAKAVLALQSPARTFPNLVGLAEAVAVTTLSPPFEGVSAVQAIAEAPKLVLQTRCLGVDITRPIIGAESSDKVYIKELTLPVIIGVHPPERVRKQPLIVNVVFHRPSTFRHADVVQRLSEYIEGTSFLTLEAFITSVARLACTMEGMDVVTVSVRKPSGISMGHSSGVEITRNKAFFERKDD